MSKKPLSKDISLKILDMIHDDCKDITNQGERCKFATKYKNKKSGQLKDCSNFCVDYFLNNCEETLADVIHRLLYGRIKLDKKEELKEDIRKRVLIEYDKRMKSEESKSIRVIRVYLRVNLLGGEIVGYNIFMANPERYERAVKIAGSGTDLDDDIDFVDENEINDNFESDVARFIKRFCSDNPKKFKFIVELDRELKKIDSIGGIKGFETDGNNLIKKFNFKDVCVIL